MKDTKKALLVILDGWGIGEIPESDAIQQANTPFIDGLMNTCSHSKLVTYGQEVGLPEGQMGNSEVGHLNLGAGRVVFQELARINNAIEDNSLSKNETLQEAIAYASNNQKPFHLIGLFSNGGVHSHINHLKALINILESSDVQQVFLHLFTDGRDTDPNAGIEYLRDLQSFIDTKKAKIATITGRYYAMDRDNRWERIKVAYDAMINAKGICTKDPISTIEAQYAEGISDEFLNPIVVNEEGVVRDGDTCLFFNFRTDRPRQITRVLTQEDMIDHGMKKLSLHFNTMTKYDESFKGLKVLFEKDNIPETLGEVLEKAGKTQLRIAETEKYPHVTFFFNGGREEPFEGEDRIMIPSPKVATYDLQPEMSAIEITDAAIKHIEDKSPDFICLNYANTDMVGHTGDFNAAMKAAETVDSCTQQLVEQALENNYDIIIIADHGNSDFMINADGSPNTAHTTNLVPCIYVSNDQETTIKDGKLADIAPTILSILGVEKPESMTGEDLFVKDK